MIQPIQPMREGPRRRAWRRLQRWQRAVVIAVVLGVLAIGAALAYFAPGSVRDDFSDREPRVVATAGPLYPPGTRYYYRRGQWLPLDQQEPPQP